MCTPAKSCSGRRSCWTGRWGVFLSPAEKRESQGPSVKDMQAKIGQLALENDRSGRVVLKQVISRSTLMRVIAQLQPCLIGLEACSGAHEWARQFQGHGHTVKLIAPAFVAPYRKSGKNDDNDAEAICEAVSRPSMRFVPVKTREQQALLSLHRVRQGFVENALPSSTECVVY